VKHTRRNGDSMNTDAEDAIINGVKESKPSNAASWTDVENTIENGVRHTMWSNDDDDVEDAIGNGVKHTEYGDWLDGDERFDDIIQNGVKETKTPGADGDILSTLEWIKENNTVNIPQLIDDVIKNGVKRTEGGMLFDETKVDRIISEGVKETKGGGYLGSIEMKGKMIHQLESPKQNNEVEEVIEYGVKLTNSSLQIDGSCVVEDVIQNGIKETYDDVYHNKGRVDGVIRNGVKETLSSIYPIERVVEKVIEVGVLEVKPAYQLMYNPTNFQAVMLEDKRIADVRDVILDGIKEVKELPDQSGELRGYGDYYHRQEDRTKPFTQYVNDVIGSGIKETKPMEEWVNTTNIVGKVISEGTSI
jgi:hypothetical protein